MTEQSGRTEDCDHDGGPRHPSGTMAHGLVCHSSQLPAAAATGFVWSRSQGGGSGGRQTRRDIQEALLLRKQTVDSCLVQNEWLKLTLSPISFRDLFFREEIYLALVERQLKVDEIVIHDLLRKHNDR